MGKVLNFQKGPKCCSKVHECSLHIFNKQNELDFVNLDFLSAFDTILVSGFLFLNGIKAFKGVEDCTSSMHKF